jgi:hypothetical protein
MTISDTIPLPGPTDAGTMVDLVNSDLLPFFDENKPADEPWSVKDQVVELVGVDEKVYIFTRSQGGQIGVWREYFANPDQWKQNRLRKWAGLPY